MAEFQGTPKNWRKVELFAHSPQEQSVVFGSLKLAFYAVESLDSGLRFQWPSGKSLIYDEILGFFKTTISKKLENSLE